MALTIGTKIDSYEITGFLGKGGMGEVYRAMDTRLGRQVAIKFSAERFSDRFEREARVIASLNHPNICTLYDVGPNYLVMELVEGPTLADRIKQGPIPYDVAMKIAGEIADALDAAHRKGIIHRDLKPANILVTKNGVKLVDFGLAKTDPVPGADDAAQTAGLSVEGAILGTLQYMSPEQLEGKDADARSDIFAFGLVLYEMIAGERAFQGSSQASIIAAILKEPAPLLSNPDTGLPKTFDRVLQTCLNKDPEKRWQSAREVKHALEWISHEVPETVHSATRPQKSRLWPVVVSVLAIALAAAGWGWWRSSRLPDLPLVRHDTDMGVNLSLLPPVVWVTNAVISPDGSRVAFVASPDAGGPPRLYIRRLDQANSVEVPGTEQPNGPFFSPDGRWIGFAANGKLNKISVDGGAVVPIMDLKGRFQGASWGEKDIVVAQLGMSLMRIRADGGGPPTKVVEFAAGENLETSPYILPGGKAVLYAGNSTGSVETASVEVASLVDGTRKTLSKGGAFPRYVSSSGKGVGHLLYTFRGALYAVPFDPDKLETRGIALPVLNDVLGPAGVAGKFDVSQAGTLIYQKASETSQQAKTTIQWIDSTGKAEPLLSRPGFYLTPRFSPDGTRILMDVREGANQDIQVYEWQSDRTVRLTFGGGFYIAPIWSPDGKYAVFGSTVGGLFWTRSDGSSQLQRLLPPVQTPRVAFSASPDGKRLAMVNVAASGAELWTSPLQEQDGQLKAGAPEVFLKKSGAAMGEPRFSPDGKWLAYRSNEAGGTDQVYVRPFPPLASGEGGQWVISTKGGSHPIWSVKSHEIFYASPQGLMAVSYTVNGTTFIAEKPRLWSSKITDSMDFDLSPDGKRVAVVMSNESTMPPKVEHDIVFLDNFFDELRRRVPIGK